VETLENKLGYVLVKNLKKELKCLEDEFLLKFWEYIPGEVEKKVFDVYEISLSLNDVVPRDIFILSLDRVYFRNADFYLDITRITDSLDGRISLGERPGSKPLAEQVKELKSCGELSLVDVGSFNGFTINEICRLLEENNITVKEVYVAFSNYKSGTITKSGRKLTSLYRYNFFDWIELRDLFGIDGRIIKQRNDKIREFIPYWENICEWASIPSEYEHDAIRLCKLYNTRLLSVLQDFGYDISKIGKHIRFIGGKK